MTLDVLNILEQEEESIDTDIGIEPLIEEPEAESDRDSDESDAEVTGNFDHLPRRILLSNVLPDKR